MQGHAGQQVAQYGGEMMYVDKSKTKPMWMTEYSRNESPRRWWDQYSPPEYHVNDVGTASLAGYNMNQDAYIRESAIGGMSIGPNGRARAMAPERGITRAA